MRQLHSANDPAGHTGRYRPDANPAQRGQSPSADRVLSSLSAAVHSTSSSARRPGARSTAARCCQLAFTVQLTHPCPPRHPARSPWTFSSHRESFFGGCSSSHGSWNASGFADPLSVPNLSCGAVVAGDVGRERGAADRAEGGRGESDLRSNAAGGEADGGL